MILIYDLLKKLRPRKRTPNGATGKGEGYN